MNMSLSLARLVLTRPLFATVIFLTTTGGALHQLTNDQNTSGARNNLSEPVNKPPTGQKAGPWGPLEAPVMEMLMRMGNEDPNQEHVKSMLNEPEPEEGESNTPGKSIADLLAQSGFQYELHNCTSPDGYITQLVRMVNPKINPNELREIPVVFYTGQGMSPAVFLVTGAPSTRRPTDWRPQANSDEDLFGEIREQVGPANRSLAVMLSNNGFDVWLVPTRGIDAQNRARQHLLTGAEASKTKSTTSKSNSANSIISTKANDTKKEDDNDNDGIPAMPDLLAEMFTKKLETGSDGGPGNSSTTARGLKSGESDLFEKLRRLVKKLAAKNYWSFSSDEIIEKELECQLELVRSVSKAPKVSVISYSNGGFIMFGFLSRRPEYAHDYLDAIINLAPAVFVNKLNLILGMASVISKLNPPDWPFLEDHIDELARTSIIKLCKCKAIRYSACKLLLNQLYGPSDMFKAQLDMALFDYIGRPVSANSLRQLLQVAYAGEMRQYDHGLLGNLIFYGKSVPSSYDLRAVNHNHLYVVSGSQDAIADSKSLTQLMGSIGCKPQSWLHIPTYNHLDLLVAHDNAKQVNLPVLKILVDRDFEVDYYRRNSNEDDDGNSTSENDQDEDEDEGDQEDFNVRYEKDKQDEANRHEAEADEEVETNSETPSHEYDGPDFYEEPKVEKLEQNEPKDHHHHHHNESLHNNEHEPHHKEHPQHHHPEQHHDDNHQKQKQQPKQEPEHETKPHAQHEHHEHHEHHDNKDLDQPKKKPEPELEREQQAPKNNEQATHLEKHPNHPEHDQHQHKHNKPGHEEGPHTLPHDHKYPDKDHRQPKKEPKAPPPPKEPHQHEPKHEPGHEPGPPHVQHDPTKHQISDQKQPKQEPKASQDQQDLQQQQDKQVQPKPSDQRQSKPEPQVNQGQDQNEDQKQQQQQPQQEKQQEPQEKGQQQPKLDQQDQERQDQPKQAPQAAGQGEARPGQQEEDEIVPSYNSQRRPPKEEPQVQDQEQDGQGQGEGEEESGRKQVAPEQPQEEQPQEQPPQQEKYPARYQVLEQKNFDNIDQEQVDQSAISVAVLDEPSNTINAQSESNNTKTNLPPANTIAALDTTTIKPVTLPTGVRTSKGKPRRATQKRRSAPGLANLLATSRTKQAQASQRSSRIEKCRQ